MTKWQELRLQALERDNHTCQLCQQQGNEVYHKIPRRFYDEDLSLDDLTTLCNRCHNLMERLTYDEPLNIDSKNIPLKFIKIKQNTYTELTKLDTGDDTMDTIINRCIEAYKKIHN
jgi:hypothetical protein